MGIEIQGRCSSSASVVWPNDLAWRGEEGERPVCACSYRVEWRCIKEQSECASPGHSDSLCPLLNFAFRRTFKTDDLGSVRMPWSPRQFRETMSVDSVKSVDMRKGEKKIGILVVAYNAASTLAAVLDRIPPEFRPRISEVIVSDDHSQDSTYLVGLGYQQISELPITLIRQPRNLGYGGNQKAGYQVAIDHGLDVVVMLHGDGQYAPECLPDLVEPLLGR